MTDKHALFHQTGKLKSYVPGAGTKESFSEKPEMKEFPAEGFEPEEGWRKGFLQKEDFLKCL